MSGGGAKRRPRVAAFPKGYFDQLIARESMTIEDWIRRAPTLGVEGVELYPSFFERTESAYLARIRRCAEDAGVELPMMCSSPDFVDPRPGAWDAAVEGMREIVDIMVELAPRAAWRSVRVLSGQAWPGVDRADGISRAVEGIEAVLSYATKRGVHLVMENHYKDGLWSYPEFAQESPVFLAIVSKIDSPWFGVNFDPSNAIVAGEDPLELLALVADRVASMHASDRSLRPGFTMDDLRAHRGTGYPQALQHGVVGQGLNDYPAIFSALAKAGFGGWVSIEDGERGGEEGFSDIADSARFLRHQIDEYWPSSSGVGEALP